MMNKFITLLLVVTISFTAANVLADTPEPTVTTQCPFIETLKAILLGQDSLCHDAPDIESGGTIGTTPVPGGPAGPGPTIVPGQGPNGLPANASLISLREFFAEVSADVKVPQCVLEGIAYIEWQQQFNYTPQQIEQYRQPGNTIPACTVNVCSAQGSMQMTVGRGPDNDPGCRGCGAGFCPNAWGTYQNAVNEFTGTSHTPNVCNLQDTVYGAAAKLKRDSGTYGTDKSRWNTGEITRAGTRYYGSCADQYRYDRIGGRTYCEFLIYECQTKGELSI